MRDTLFTLAIERITIKNVDRYKISFSSSREEADTCVTFGIDELTDIVNQKDGGFYDIETGEKWAFHKVLGTVTLFTSAHSVGVPMSVFL